MGWIGKACRGWMPCHLMPPAISLPAGTVMTLGAVGVAIVAGGAAAGPLQKMIDAEAAAP